MKAELLITIIKWSIIIMITGFIAQFGKKFGEYLIERAKTPQRRTLPRREDITSDTITANPVIGATGKPAVSNAGHHIKKMPDPIRNEYAEMKKETK